MFRFALSLVLAFAVWPVLAADPLIRDFRDWQASCSAVAAACIGWTGDPAGQASLMVRRASRPQVEWELRLQLPAAVTATAQVLVLQVDEQRQQLQRGRDWYEGDVAGEVVLVDDPQEHAADRLFLAMGKGSALAVDAAGGFHVRLSLRGLKASQLWMDERQGLADAWPLLQAPATRPGIAPAIRQAQRRYADDTVLADIRTLPPAVRRQREQATDCLALAEAADGRGYQVQWLDAYTALFSLPCQLTAREPLHLHVVAHAPDFTDALVIAFPVWDESQPEPEVLARPLLVPVPTLALPVLLPGFNRLQLVQQDVLGGLEQTWRWDGQAMQLIEVRSMVWQDDREGTWRIRWQELAARR